MKKTVLSIDPGISDPTGINILEGTYPEKKIFVRYSRETTETWHRVIDQLIKINNQIKPDLVQVESNNRGHEFIEQCIAKGFPVTGINTTINLSEFTRDQGLSVDKKYMVYWLKNKQEAHDIQYANTGMDGLLKQRQEMMAIPSGRATPLYRAKNSRHDDQFMAYLIGANAIRVWWDRKDG